MVLYKTAYVNHELGDGRQRFVAKHVMENHLEFRHDKDEEKSHDRHRHRDDDGRIDHGRDDLVLDLRSFLLKFREPVQNKLQYTAELACFHHVNVKVVKDSWMKGKSVGKRITALDGVREFVDRFFQYEITFLFCQNVQAAQQWQPGIDQRCQLTRKKHQDLWLNCFALEKDNVGLAARSCDTRHFRGAPTRYLP